MLMPLHRMSVIHSPEFVSSNSDLTRSGCTFISGKTVLDSRGLLRVSAGKSVARLCHSDCTCPNSQTDRKRIWF